MAVNIASMQTAKLKIQLITGHVVQLWSTCTDQMRPAAATARSEVSPRVRDLHLELKTRRGAHVLIQIRSLPNTQIIRLGDKLSIRTHALLPLYQLPNITDDLLANTSAGQGAVVHFRHPPSTIFTSTDASVANVDIITKYNAAIPSTLMERYHELRTGIRRQVTWKLLSERIEIWPDHEHLMYLSAVLLEVSLVRLWKEGRLYCMPCEGCGGVVFANEVVGPCDGCERGVELRINPNVLALVSDETGGLGGGRGGHNLLVADEVWVQLFGTVANAVVRDGEGGGVTEKWLRERERKMQYQRHTWVLMWTGTWAGGRLVVVDVLDWQGRALC